LCSSRTVTRTLLAYRFDIPDGSVVFSGNTTVNDELIALARGADVLVHHVADLDHLERQGLTGADLRRMAALHTDVNEVGGVANAQESVNLSWIISCRPKPYAITETEWEECAGRGFGWVTIAGGDGMKQIPHAGFHNDVSAICHNDEPNFSSDLVRLFTDIRLQSRGYANCPTSCGKHLASSRLDETPSFWNTFRRW
jgi:hypothetical protein